MTSLEYDLLEYMYIRSLWLQLRRGGVLDGILTIPFRAPRLAEISQQYLYSCANRHPLIGHAFRILQVMALQLFHQLSCY